MNKKPSARDRRAALAAGLSSGAQTGSAPTPARAERRRRSGVRQRLSALQWYAERGALVDGDEDAALNDRRREAGEALARLFDQAFRRPRLTARYEARAAGGISGADAVFVRSETARRRFEEKFAALPARTRSVIRLCVIDDAFVGRSRMERLRCGLDKLVEIDEGYALKK